MGPDLSSLLRPTLPAFGVKKHHFLTRQPSGLSQELNFQPQTVPAFSSVAQQPTRNAFFFFLNNVKVIAKSNTTFLVCSCLAFAPRNRLLQCILSLSNPEFSRATNHRADHRLGRPLGFAVNRLSSFNTCCKPANGSQPCPKPSLLSGTCLPKATRVSNPKLAAVREKKMCNLQIK